MKPNSHLYARNRIEVSYSQCLAKTTAPVSQPADVSAAMRAGKSDNLLQPNFITKSPKNINTAPVSHRLTQSDWPKKR